MSKTLDQELDNDLRQKLIDRLWKLQPHQRDRFKEIWAHPYPGKNPVFEMTSKQVYDSIDLCDRTLKADTTKSEDCEPK